MVDPKTPQNRTDEDLLQLTLELYARTGMYPCSKGVHDAAFAAKAEVLKRMARAEQNTLCPVIDPKTERQKFRKKPVVIEAFRLGIDCIPDWFMDKVSTNEIILHGERDELETAEIVTLEGTMTAMQGEYIIRGIKGEIYPCKPDIFAATYESVARAEPDKPTPRQLVYRFMQLPTHSKLERLRDLGIYVEGDYDLPGDECDLVWVKRAKEAGCLDELLSELSCGCKVTKGWRCPVHNAP